MSQCGKKEPGRKFNRRRFVMALFLFLVLVAVALGIIGAVVEGLLYILVIGAIVFVCALTYAALRFRRGGHRRR